MGGGSGGGGTTNVAQFKPPDYATQGWADLVNNATAITQTPQQIYNGMQVAPINNTQVQGMQLMANLAGNNAPDYAAARANNQITAMGGFEDPYATLQTEVGYNPWQGDYIFGQNGEGVQKNAYEDRSIALRPNAYTGFNPAYNAMKEKGMNDIVRAYQTGTAAQTDTAFNRGSGAFRGGAHDAQIGANQYGLGQALSSLGSQMDMGQWAQSAQYDDAALNRDLQAQSTDYARQSGINENYLNRVQNALQTDTARNSGIAENALNRGMQAQQGDLNRASGAWQQERQRQVGALPAAIQAQQNDLGNAQRLIGVGDAQRQYQQDMLNQYKNSFDQWNNYPMQMADIYSSLLSRASGNYGQSTSQTQQNYQANPLAALIGGGLLGAGAYNAWGG